MVDRVACALMVARAGQTGSVPDVCPFVPARCVVMMVAVVCVGNVALASPAIAISAVRSPAATRQGFPGVTTLPSSPVSAILIRSVARPTVPGVKCASLQRRLSVALNADKVA